MPISITITGMEQGLSTVQRLIQKLSTVGQQVFQQAGQEMVSEMQSRAPVDTGFLRDNIRVAQSSNNILQVVSGADYSAYVEYGTWKMSAQPFFYPVAQPMMSQIAQRMSAYLNSG